MKKQDLDVLIACVVGGVTMLACMTGLGWGLYGLLRLTRIRKEDS